MGQFSGMCSVKLLRLFKIIQDKLRSLKLVYNGFLFIISEMCLCAVLFFCFLFFFDYFKMNGGPVSCQVDKRFLNRVSSCEFNLKKWCHVWYRPDKIPHLT